jgi:hypothetical protein
MNTYTFKVCPATAKATFTCPACGKPKRTRTFRVECTVNPFNKHEDGHVRTYTEVSRQSAAQARQKRDEFMTKPLCAKCEDAMSYAERKALRAERKATAQEPKP